MPRVCSRHTMAHQSSQTIIQERLELAGVLTGEHVDRCAHLQQSSLAQVGGLRGGASCEQGNGGGRQEGTQRALVRGSRQPRACLQAALPRRPGAAAQPARVQRGAAAARVPRIDVQQLLGSCEGTTDIVQREALWRQSLRAPETS